MKFEAIARDCNTRTGYAEIEGRKIKVPNIFWYSSPRLPAPSFAEIKLGEDIGSGGSFFYPKECTFCIPPRLIYPYAFPEEFHKKAFSWNNTHTNIFEIVSAKGGEAKNGFIFVLANSREVFSNPKNFVECIVKVRGKIGYKLLYAPGIATPVNLAFLAYCGIDFFDSLQIILKSRKGIYFTSDGEHLIEELDEYPCSCPFCMKGIGKFEDLLMHNYEVMKNELIKISQYIKQGRLREYVEGKANLSPHLASIIRLMDARHYEYQEKRYPLTGKKFVSSLYSLSRPDIKRFRERVLNRYKKPDSAKILLLLPCSAKKPYSLSKSHKIFNRIISNCKNRYAIHEVIITSPLAIVPRELEYTYPSAHYDISTIGQWYRDEIEMIEKSLREYLRRNKYEVIINHLPEELSSLSLNTEIINTCSNHPTSEESLKKLSSSLAIAEDFEKISHTKRRYENTLSMLLFQFGNIANKFLRGCKVKGKFPEYKIYYEEKQLASFVAKRGLFSLTFAGGKKMGKNYWVEIEDFKPKGSIFSVGVINADERIRIGDETIAFYEDELRAVGVAKMNAEEMVESDAGEAIKVRHYK